MGEGYEKRKEGNGARYPNRVDRGAHCEIEQTHHGGSSPSSSFWKVGGRQDSAGLRRQPGRRMRDRATHENRTGRGLMSRAGSSQKSDKIHQRARMPLGHGSLLSTLHPVRATETGGLAQGGLTPIFLARLSDKAPPD